MCLKIDCIVLFWIFRVSSRPSFGFSGAFSAFLSHYARTDVIHCVVDERADSAHFIFHSFAARHRSEKERGKRLGVRFLINFSRSKGPSGEREKRLSMYDFCRLFCRGAIKIFRVRKLGQKKNYRQIGGTNKNFIGGGLEIRKKFIAKKVAFFTAL